MAENSSRRRARVFEIPTPPAPDDRGGHLVAGALDSEHELGGSHQGSREASDGTRPLRRTILQFSQMRFTLARTFMGNPHWEGLGYAKATEYKLFPAAKRRDLGLMLTILYFVGEFPVFCRARRQKPLFWGS